jgi:VCBS repeat-containing protein
MNQEIFARYADIKKQIAELEDQLEELKPEVTAELKELPNNSAKLPFGVFNLQKRAKWTYSETIQQLDQQLKAGKKEEEQNGIATAEYTEYVMFKGAAAAAVA